MQSKYIHSPQSLSSSLTIDTFKSRKPRFQRQNTLGKCDCSSTSKSRLSCDSLSLEKLYIKGSFLKSPKKLLNEEDNEKSSKLSIFHNLQEESHINENIRNSIQKSNGCQFLEDSNNCSNSNCDSIILLKENDQNLSYKDNMNKSLKEAIFYKQKCQKLELKIKDYVKQKQKSQDELNRFKQYNLKLKKQIQNLKKANDLSFQKEQPRFNTQKKPRNSINKNLSKLKQQYANFRQQQDLTKALSDPTFDKISKMVKQLKRQNEKLSEDLFRQNQHFNMRIKMMQEKEEFLEKTLSFTKNALNQLQKDYIQKQVQILESKRLNDIINQKNNQIDKISLRYNNLLKIVNGQKKRTQNNKNTNKKSQKIEILSQLKSKHSLETKNIICGHKQNDQLMKQNFKQTIKNQQKIDKNSLVINVYNNNHIKAKQNYRMTELKSTLNLPTNEVQQTKFLKRNNSDLTLSSFNSFELSPQK